MSKDRIPNPLLIFTKMVFAPALLFAGFFFVLTYPALIRFKTHFYADQGDGLQNVWNLWWVQKAIIVLHQSPWHTWYLHYPYGTTLIGHTLNAFNGFAGIALSRFLSPVPVHNVIVTFSFVAGGVTAFLLAHHLTKLYWPSLIAGYIFTFSSFHFAHAEGHLQIVSLEWIPLFVLLWLKLLSKPTIALGAGSAGVLFLVILCDYYYFFYCVLTGLIIFCWFLLHSRIPSFSKKEFWVPLYVFAALALGTSGSLAGSLVFINLTDGLVGNASPVEYSLDLLAPFIYGGHWRFASLTSAYWTRLTGNIHESSVHLGLTVVLLLILVWRKKKFVDADEIGLLYLLLFFFGITALGPTLHIAGRKIFPWLPWPYAWFEAIFPPLRVASDPVRMMVMVILCAAMISAFGFRQLFRGTRRGKMFGLILVMLLFIEYLPKPIPMTLIAVPEYVKVLKNLPGSDGVLDLVANPTLNQFYEPAPSLNLFYQTVHEKPLAFGYLARIPRSVEQKDEALAKVIRSSGYSRLWSDYHFRYVVSEDVSYALRNSPGIVIVWTDGKIWLFDISHVESRFGDGGIVMSN